VDIELASRLEIDGILVKTGYGLGEIDHVLPQQSIKPSHIAQDLLDAVKWILGKNPR
jgi:ribonucleotide monophosphatase NagD (HAD superfamily)